MQPLKQEKIFTNHQLLTLLWPLIIEQTLSVLVGMADTVMVSSVGEAAISGVSLVDMINQLIITVFAALATGGAVVTSQYLGAKKPEQAARSAGQLVGLSALLGLAVAAFCLLTRRPMLRLLFGSITDDVMDAALVYFTITALSFPFLALYNAGAAIFRSTGNSAVSMKVSVIVNAINFCGNAICIFVLGMGVEGVAIPTLISRAVGAFIILGLATQHEYVLHITPRSVTHLEGGIVKSILRIGIPSACENSLFQLGRVLVVQVIAYFGTVQTAANAVANVLDSVGVLPGQTINLAMISVVGQCVGARDFKQARHYTRKLLIWTYIATICLNVPLLLSLPWILPIFDASPEALELAKKLIFIHDGMAMLMWPLAFSLPNALRAASDVRYTMVVALGSMAVFRIVFSYILGIGLGWGAVGVWIAMIIDWVCRIVFYAARYRSGKWEEKARIAA